VVSIRPFGALDHRGTNQTGETISCVEFSVIFIAGPEDVPLIISGINEVKVRGARTIVIAEDDPRLRANADDVIALPKSDTSISPLLAVIPLQVLSYHMSVMRGFDPDIPRNLSKTLTVDLPILFG